MYLVHWYTVGLDVVACDISTPGGALQLVQQQPGQHLRLGALVHGIKRCFTEQRACEHIQDNTAAQNCHYLR